MPQLTQIEGVPDRDSVHEGMAHFAGTGPWRKTCGQCLHRGYYRDVRNRHGTKVSSRKTNACAMFKQLTGKHGGVVQLEWSACKYFEPIEVWP